MTLTEKVRSAAHAVRNYRSKTHANIERVTDHLALWSVANAGYAVGMDRGLNWVSQNTDKYEGLAMMGAWGAVLGGAYALNRFALPAISTKLRDYKRKHARKPANALHFVKNAAQIGALGAVLAYGDKNDALENYRSDFNRISTGIIQAFERPTDTQPAVLDTAGTEVITTAPLRTTNFGPSTAGAAKGYNMNALYAQLTGVTGKMPAIVNVDFCNQLEEMWQLKGKRKDITPVAVQAGKQFVKECRTQEPTRMTLNDYIGEANKSIVHVRSNIDWNKLGKIYHLNNRELAVTRNIANSINGRDLLAYSFTELMPAPDGKKNMAVMDFLLRNAGREYVESFPALGDGLTSDGLYQFTHFAVNGVDKEGASRANQALPPQAQIPGSVALLRGNDHHKAAYLFAINNLARLANKAGGSRAKLNTLEDSWAAHKDDIIKYIATAHHAPGDALKIADRWLDNDAKADYTISAHGRFIPYSIKTAANLKALYAGKPVGKPHNSP